MDDTSKGLSRELGDAPTMVSPQTGPPGSATADTVLVESDRAPAASSSPGEVRLGPASLEETGFEARYSRGRLLGEGGMGEVYLCQDERIGRRVALKLVRRTRGFSANAQERFVREARVQGQLEHPAIVPVYDLGLSPDGQAYFTMKNVRGVTLDQVIRGEAASASEERFSPRRLLSAFGQVCLGIDFAHERGVLHRDLKPQNIMLGDFGEVYVLDWGLAKVAGVADVAAGGDTDDGRAADGDGRVAASGPIVAPDSGAMTVEGDVLGTPGYMAPEQLSGRVAELDRRADVYSLGAILFEVLTGEPLHRRESTQALVASTLEGVEARPSVRAPDLDVPPELEEVLVRATRVDPAERLPNARALHQAVQSYLDGDRDLARRRELATEHAAEAERLAEAALAAGGDDATADERDTRAHALREVGRALALDPEQPRAIAALVRLLSEPPAQTPPEVAEAMARDEAEQRNATARMGTWAYLSFFFYLPVALWMGVREWGTIGAAGVGMLLAALSCAYKGHSRRESVWPEYVALVTSTGSMILMSRIFGPYLIIPGYLAANTIAYAMTSARGRKAIFLMVGALGFILPVILERTVASWAMYRFDGGTLVIAPRALTFSVVPTMFMLIIGTAQSIAVGVWGVGRMRATALEAEQRNQMSTWQLRQLVPPRVFGEVEPTRTLEPRCFIERR